MTEDRKKSETEATRQSRKAGVRAFAWTMVVLLVLVVAYALTHVATLREYVYMHYEAADVTSARQDLLVTVVVLEGQLEIPAAIAAPAFRALFHDLGQSVLRAETSEEVTGLFGTAARELAELGIREAISPKMLEAAQTKTVQFVSASESEREVAQQLFQAELGVARTWPLDALGSRAVLSQVDFLREKTSSLGYGAESEVGQTLAEIIQELGLDRPSRRNGLEPGGDVGGEAMADREAYR